MNAKPPARGRASPGSAGAAPRPAAPPAAAAAPRPGRRLLLVEDHRDTRRTMQLHLQAAQHTVMAAANAAEALQLAQAHSFDLVISDLGLPDEGGGLELMRRLRAAHGLPGIAVSGHGEVEDVARSQAAGFGHHLVKPINIGELLRLIGEKTPAAP